MYASTAKRGVEQVVLKQPVPASVSESEAISDDVLVSAALEMFGEASNDAHAQPQAQAPTPAATHVAGVIKSPSNHLVSRPGLSSFSVFKPTWLVMFAKRERESTDRYSLGKELDILIWKYRVSWGRT